MSIWYKSHVLPVALPFWAVLLGHLPSVTSLAFLSNLLGKNWGSSRVLGIAINFCVSVFLWLFEVSTQSRPYKQAKLKI